MSLSRPQSLLDPHDVARQQQSLDPDDGSQLVSVNVRGPWSSYAQQETDAASPHLASGIASLQSMLPDMLRRATTAFDDAFKRLVAVGTPEDQACAQATDAALQVITPHERETLEVLAEPAVEVVDVGDGPHQFAIRGDGTGYHRVLGVRRRHVITRPGHVRSPHDGDVDSCLDHLATLITGIHPVHGDVDQPATGVSPRVQRAAMDAAQMTPPFATADIPPMSDPTFIPLCVACIRSDRPFIPAPPPPDDPLPDDPVKAALVQSERDAAKDAPFVGTPLESRAVRSIVSDLGYDPIDALSMDCDVLADVLRYRLVSETKVLGERFLVPAPHESAPLSRLTPPSMLDWMPSAPPPGYRGCFQRGPVTIWIRSSPPRTCTLRSAPNWDCHEGSVILPDGTASATAAANLWRLHHLLSRLGCPWRTLRDAIAFARDHQVLDRRTWRRHMSTARSASALFILDHVLRDPVLADKFFDAVTADDDLDSIPSDSRTPVGLAALAVRFALPAMPEPRRDRPDRRVLTAIMSRLLGASK